MIESPVRRHLLLAGIGLALVFFITAVAGTVWTIHALNDTGITAGVWAGPWDVGGMTRAEAYRFIEEQKLRFQEEPIRLEYAGRSWMVTPAQLGITFSTEALVGEAYAVARTGGTWNRVREKRRVRSNRLVLPLPLEWEAARFAEYAALLENEINRPSLDARILWDKNNGVTIVNHQYGQTLKTDELEVALGAVAYRVRHRRIHLPVHRTPPGIIADELREGDFSTTYAQYSTKFDAQNTDRVHNLHMAAAGVHGVLMRPGDIFSFNERVGPRVAEKGYREAPVQIAGELVPGIGGGVCQVSTTLFNAALLADLKIVRRTNHSRPVAYVPLGRDATVVDNYIDFQFMNDTVYPLYLLAEVGKDTMTVRVLGPSTVKRRITLESRVIEEIPFGELEERDPTLLPGQQKVDKLGAPGYKVEVWRKVSIDQVVVKNELVARANYRPVATLIKVGPW